METLRMNRFPDKRVQVKYFFIESRLNLVYAVVSETEDQIHYYDVCMAPFWSNLANTTVYEMAVNPTGERYDTGEPAVIHKEDFKEGLFINSLDITASRDEVYYRLTGRKKQAVVQNVIG